MSIISSFVIMSHVLSDFLNDKTFTFFKPNFLFKFWDVNQSLLHIMLVNGNIAPHLFSQNRQQVENHKFLKS